MTVERFIKTSHLTGTVKAAAADHKQLKKRVYDENLFHALLDLFLPVMFVSKKKKSTTSILREKKKLEKKLVYSHEECSS